MRVILFSELTIVYITFEHVTLQPGHGHGIAARAKSSAFLVSNQVCGNNTSI
jgi:hypothetical protein